MLFFLIHPGLHLRPIHCLLSVAHLVSHSHPLSVVEARWAGPAG